MSGWQLVGLGPSIPARFPSRNLGRNCTKAMGLPCQGLGEKARLAQLPNTYVHLVDSQTSDIVKILPLVEGGVVDTGWLHREFDLSKILANYFVVEIRLRLADGWVADHSQQVWLDSMRVFVIHCRMTLLHC